MSIITQDGEPLGYIIQFQGRTYSPDHQVSGGYQYSDEQIEAHNEALDQKYLSYLDTCPIGEGITVYLNPGTEIVTWRGARIGDGIRKPGTKRTYLIHRNGRVFQYTVPRGDRQDAFLKRVK